MRFPTNLEIEKVLSSLSDDDFEVMLPKNASKIDRIKYQLCHRVVGYLVKRGLTQSELARKIKIDRSRVNWIVKYRINHFSIDRLYEIASSLDSKIELRII